MKSIFLRLIKIYKVISRPIYFMMPAYMGCRFWPSCSDYSYNALDKFGVYKGSILTAKRLLKCNPLHGGGVDNI